MLGMPRSKSRRIEVASRYYRGGVRVESMKQQKPRCLFIYALYYYYYLMSASNCAAGRAGRVRSGPKVQAGPSQSPDKSQRFKFQIRQPRRASAEPVTAVAILIADRNVS